MVTARREKIANLDALAPNYRRAQQRWPSAPMLVNNYNALAACFSDSAHGLLEHVKSFIESVCRTIIAELGEPMPSTKPTTTELLVAALRAVGMSNAKGASKLDAVLSGFNKLSNALGAARNETGPVAHGKDGFLDSVTVDHARAFLHVGDAILGVLLNALEGKIPNLTVTREPYETFKHLNDRIDRYASVQARVDEESDQPVVVVSIATGSCEEAIELRLEPSRLLYGTDRQAYIEILQTTDAVSVAAEDEAKEHKKEKEAAVFEPDETPPVRPVEVAEPVTVVVSGYGGALDTLRSGLGAFLASEGVKPTVASAGKEKLLDSLLATADKNMVLDWKSRELAQARLKVACKRVLVRFGTTPEKARKVAECMVTWLCVQVADDGGMGSVGSPSVKGENGS